MIKTNYSRPRNIHLRPQFWHENDRKSEADLLKYQFNEVRIFDQKIIEVANINLILSSEQFKKIYSEEFK